MMMDPMEYYDEFLKGKDEKQIQTEIRSLKRGIGRLKKIIEHPDYGKELIWSPSEDVQIFCMREYLTEAFFALLEVNGKYEVSKAEMKALDFQDDLSDVSKIILEMNNCENGSIKYIAEIEEDNIKLICYKDSISPEIKTINKNRFFSDLKELYVDEWHRHYNPKRFGFTALDGVKWQVVFEYRNGHRPKRFNGDSDYPYNFKEFKSLFEPYDIDLL